MGSARPIRQYLLVRTSDALLEIYDKNDPSAARSFVLRLFELGKGRAASFRVVSLPSRKWILQTLDLAYGKKAETKPKAARRPPDVDDLVVALEFDDREAVDAFRAAVLKKKTRSFLGMGVDLAFHAADCWCPGEADDALFAGRGAAHALIGADHLRHQGLTGRGVNVVIVDQGLAADRVPHFGGGWSYQGRVPGGSPQRAHGSMVARNVHTIAPDAVIWDCPVIPPAITNLGGFLSEAQAAYDTVLAHIAAQRAAQPNPGPWVMVNAWAMFDRRLEAIPGDYTDNLNHPFNMRMDTLDAAKIDVVFAAGNCGQFCPQARCGVRDRGPGRSILGANSHPDVLTTGAVRADGMWLGMSSQGPGQPHMAHDKPDLCAPSQFREDVDHFLANTGTSAACGIAAGVVAALRQRWDQGAISPGELRDILRSTAGGGGWNRRLGFGIIDAEAAFEKARRQHP